jgi:phosphoglycolate phosphatase
MGPRRTILFDFDGTLVDTAPGIVRTATRVLAEYGMTPEEIGDESRLMGPPFPYGYELVYGLPHDDAVAVTARYRELYKSMGPEDYPLFPGVPEMLSGLKEAGFKLGLATSRLETLTLEMVSNLGIRDLFDVVAGQHPGDPVGKVHIVARALAELGAAPDDAVMVGDRRFDVEGARANGLPCVCIDTGTAEPGELEAAGAAYVARSHAELGRVLAHGFGDTDVSEV